MGNSPNHIKFIKLHSRNRRTFFNIVATICVVSRRHTGIQDSPPALGDIWLQSLKNSTRVWLLSHRLKKTKDAFRLFPRTNEECAKLVGLPPGKSILHRWFIYAWIENLSCGTDKLVLLSPLIIHASLLSRSCPRKCCMLPTAVSECFGSLLCLIWKRRP